MFLRILPLLALAIVLTGCWNGGNTHVDLGTSSIGRQLIDLKLALEEDAISQDEYDTTKQALLTLQTACSSDDD